MKCGGRNNGAKHTSLAVLASNSTTRLLRRGGAWRCGTPPSSTSSGRSRSSIRVSSSRRHSAGLDVVDEPPRALSDCLGHEGFFRPTKDWDTPRPSASRSALPSMVGVAMATRTGSSCSTPSPSLIGARESSRRLSDSFWHYCAHLASSWLVANGFPKATPKPVFCAPSTIIRVPHIGPSASQFRRSASGTRPSRRYKRRGRSR